MQIKQLSLRGLEILVYLSRWKVARKQARKGPSETCQVPGGRHQGKEGNHSKQGRMEERKNERNKGDTPTSTSTATTRIIAIACTTTTIVLTATKTNLTTTTIHSNLALRQQQQQHYFFSCGSACCAADAARLQRRLWSTNRSVFKMSLRELSAPAVDEPATEEPPLVKHQGQESNAWLTFEPDIQIL